MMIDILVIYPTSELRLHINHDVVCSCYPGILYGCQMDFVKDWPQYALEGEASHYLERHKVVGDIAEQTRQIYRLFIFAFLAYILSFCIPFLSVEGCRLVAERSCYFLKTFLTRESFCR